MLYTVFLRETFTINVFMEKLMLFMEGKCFRFSFNRNFNGSNFLYCICGCTICRHMISTCNCVLSIEMAGFLSVRHTMHAVLFRIGLKMCRQTRPYA